MTQGYCTDKAALIGFLYDDCETGEREQIAAHVADCPDCTAELASLSATRRQLAAWVPPQAALGFQVDSTQVAGSLKGTQPFTLFEGGMAGAGGPARAATPWWRQPLPAWGQAAAAVLIFAAGVGFGTGRTGAADNTPTTSSGRTVPAGVRATPVSATNAAAVVVPEHLTRLEEKLQALQAEIATLRAAGAAGTTESGGTDTGVTLAEVHDLVAATEAKLQNQILVRDASLQTAQQVYFQRIGNLIDPLQRAHVQELWQQGEPAQSLSGPAIGLRNVSFTR